jgi:hypothetical protein
MKEYIDKLKEIETLVELSIGTTMTEEKATDIYAVTNDLMCKVKKLNIADVGSRFTSMTRDEAIQYCYEHKDEYIRDFDSISEGRRQFDCLIEILEHGTIQPSELPQYGMDF